MKFLSSLFVITIATVAPVSFSHAALGKGGVERPISKEVESYSRALKSSGLSGKIEGLKALSETRPAINKILEKISTEIVKGKAQKNITANKAQFDTLTENINAAAMQAAEMRASGARYEGSSAKLLESIESLPGILLEVANAGPKADMQKALDVSRMLAELRERDLSNEADASAKKKAIEERLGVDKEGKQITLEELIKRCLGA